MATARLIVRALRRAEWFAEGHIDNFLERRYGVTTADRISLKDLGVDGENRIWHHPCNWIALWVALRRQKPGPDDVFVDLGAGLGRALLVAGRFPFRRVIGVELSDQLADQARRNVLVSAGRLRAGSVEVVTADALQWEIPDEATYFYLYSPFTGRLFGHVFGRILDSLDRRPRTLRLVYEYPVEHDQVIGSGRAEPIDISPGSFPRTTGQPDDVIVTYLLLPSAGRDTIPGKPPRPSRRLERHPEWIGPYDPGFVLREPGRRSKLPPPESDIPAAE